jgi:RimK family alpha-L-glutamate ligase
MKIDIITTNFRSWENNQIKKELKKKKVECEFISPEYISYQFVNDRITLFYKDKTYSLPDLVFCRGGLLQDSLIFKSIDFLNILSLLGVKIVDNKDSVFSGKGKLYTCARMFQKKVLYPNSFMIYDERLRDLIKFMPVVVKPLDGKQGKDVKKFGSIQEFKENLNGWLAQESLNCSSSDLRVLVLGNQALGGIIRCASSKDEWRSNCSLGGKASSSSIPPFLTKLAIKAAKICNYDFAGIDFVFDNERKKYYLLEVNRSPQFEAFSNATKMNVAEKISNYLINKAL